MQRSKTLRHIWAGRWTPVLATCCNATRNARWDDVAPGASCANCTLVCPTCFCSTIEDTTDLTGHISERWRRWDSCFTLDFSYIHGGT
jgi:hypothetical protein